MINWDFPKKKPSNYQFQSTEVTTKTTSNGRSNENNMSHETRSGSPYNYFRGFRRSNNISSNMESRDHKDINHKHSHSINGTTSSFDGKTKSSFDKSETNNLISGSKTSRQTRSKSDLIPTLRGSSHFTFSGSYAHGGSMIDSSISNEKEVDSPRSSEISIGVDLHSAYSGGKPISPASNTSRVAQISGLGQNRRYKPKYEMVPKYNARTNEEKNHYNHIVGPSSRVTHNPTGHLGTKGLRFSSNLKKRRIKPKIRRIKSSDVYVSSEDEVDSAGADVDSDDFLDDDSAHEDEETGSRDENDKDKLLVTAGVTSPFLRLVYAGRPLNPFPTQHNSPSILKTNSKNKDDLTQRKKSVKSESPSNPASPRPRSTTTPIQIAASTNSFIPASVSKTFNTFFPSILS